MERVVGVTVDGAAVALPFSALEASTIVNTSISGRDIVVFHQPGVASALAEEIIHEGREVGATGVFIPVADGRRLTFRLVDGVIRDDETGSSWTIVGRASDGVLAGAQLEAVPHVDAFWFAWAVFRPDTTIYTPAEKG